MMRCPGSAGEFGDTGNSGTRYQFRFPTDETDTLDIMGFAKAPVSIWPRSLRAFTPAARHNTALGCMT
jgi:hypothetical protein